MLSNKKQEISQTFFNTLNFAKTGEAPGQPDFNTLNPNLGEASDSKKADKEIVKGKISNLSVQKRGKILKFKTYNFLKKNSSRRNQKNERLQMKK